MVDVVKSLPCWKCNRLSRSIVAVDCRVGFRQKSAKYCWCPSRKCLKGTEWMPSLPSWKCPKFLLLRCFTGRGLVRKLTGGGLSNDLFHSPALCSFLLYSQSQVWRSCIYLSKWHFDIYYRFTHKYLTLRIGDRAISVSLPPDSCAAELALREYNNATAQVWDFTSFKCLVILSLSGVSKSGM